MHVDVYMSVVGVCVGTYIHECGWNECMQMCT